MDYSQGQMRIVKKKKELPKEDCYYYCKINK